MPPLESNPNVFVTEPGSAEHLGLQASRVGRTHKEFEVGYVTIDPATTAVNGVASVMVILPRRTHHPSTMAVLYANQAGYLTNTENLQVADAPLSAQVLPGQILAKSVIEHHANTPGVRGLLRKLFDRS